MDEACNSAQAEFDAIYITSSEICRELKVTRATIVQGRKRGMLPNPIFVNGAQIMIWKRSSVRAYIDAWHIMLQSRRGELAA